MLVHEPILGQFDIGCENNFDLGEYLQCLGELGFEIISWKK